jgi:hypothetical protein
MSEADHTRKGCDIVKGHKSAAMQTKNFLTRGRVVASFADQHLKGRKVNAFCQTD